MTLTDEPSPSRAREVRAGVPPAPTVLWPLKLNCTNNQDTTCLPRGRRSPGTGDPKASRASGHSAHHTTTEVSLYFVSTCLVTTGTQRDVNATHSWEEKPLGPQHS